VVERELAVSVVQDSILRDNLRRGISANTLEGQPMIRLRLLLVLSFCSMPATAADLSKMDRTIAKEPKYQSKPKYCLLVFGPEGKTRVWLVLDGDVLYVDRNGNGDLTEAEERISGDRNAAFPIGKIVEVDSKVCHDLELRAIQKDQDNRKETLHILCAETNGYKETA
jgi:hypothetical protein